MKVMVSAYLDNNIGDDLMIKLMAKYFISHEFYLYSNKSIIKKTFADCENIVVRKQSDLKNDIPKVDLFLSIGGSIFNDLNSLRGQINRLRKIKFIKKLKRKGVKIATIGCNLGPYTGKIGPILTKYELKLNDLVTVRDKSSFELLTSFKTIKNFHLANDIVYNYKITKNNVLKDCGLGISAYRSLRKDENNYMNYLKLSDIVDEYIDKTDKNVRLFAFDTENENDLSAAYHIFNLSKNKEKIEIVPYLGDISSFIKKLNKCERFLSIRFHSAVLSDLFSIPFFPVIYSNKMESLLSDRSYTGEKIYLKDIDDKLQTEKIVDTIIEGENIYNSFNNQPYNSIQHFEELSKLLAINNTN